MEKLKLFGHSYNLVGDTNTDFVIKTKGLVKVLWGRKFIDIIKDGELNVNNHFLRRVPTREDVGNADGIYVTDDGSVYLVSGGVTIALVGEAGTFYVSYIGDLDVTQQAKLLALKNLGIVFQTMDDAANITEGFVYIQEDRKFYTVLDGIFTPYPPNLDSDVLTIDKRIITILNSGRLVIKIQDGIISIDAPIESSESILADLLISNTIKSESGTTERGFLVTTTGGISTLYVDYLVVRRGLEEEETSWLTGNILYSFKRNYMVSYDFLGFNPDEEEEEEEETEEEEEEEEPTEYIFTLAWPQTYKLGDKLEIYTVQELEITEPNPDYDPNDENSEENITRIEYNYVSFNFTVLADSAGNTVTVAGDPIPSDIEVNGKEIFLTQTENGVSRYSDLENLDLITLDEEPTIHSRIGNVDEFKTYGDKQYSQGVYSDLPVFAGGEFRQPMGENPTPEVLDFPRYSKFLNNDLCTNHLQVADNDDFEDVIPTIKWVKRNSLNSPLREINQLNSTPVDKGYILISTLNGWQFYNLATWMNLMEQCCEEVMGSIALTPKYTVHWVSQDVELKTTKVSENEYASYGDDALPVYVGETPEDTMYVFNGWYPDPETTVITLDTTFTALWKWIKICLEVSTTTLEHDDTSLIVYLWIEDLDDNRSPSNTGIASLYVTNPIQFTGITNSQYNGKRRSVLTVSPNTSGSIKVYKPYTTYLGLHTNKLLTVTQLPSSTIRFSPFDVISIRYKWDVRADLDIGVFIDNATIIPVYNVEQIIPSITTDSDKTETISIAWEDGVQYKVRTLTVGDEVNVIKVPISPYPIGNNLYYILNPDGTKLLLYSYNTQYQNLSKVISGFGTSSNFGTSAIGSNQFLLRDVANYFLYSGDNTVGGYEGIALNLRNVTASDFLAAGINELYIKIYAYWYMGGPGAVEFNFSTFKATNPSTFTILDNPDNHGNVYTRLLITNLLTFMPKNGNTGNYYIGNNNMQTIYDGTNDSVRFYVRTKYGSFPRNADTLKANGEELGTLIYNINDQTAYFVRKGAEVQST